MFFVLTHYKNIYHILAAPDTLVDASDVGSQTQHGNTVAREAVLPNFDEDIPARDQRLSEVGFRVSPTQEETPPDGDCGIWATLGK